jgi:hypothetical protein
MRSLPFPFGVALRGIDAAQVASAGERHYKREDDGRSSNKERNVGIDRSPM